MRICFGEISIKNDCYIKSGALEINEGEINVLLGKNGTGKSLLLSYIHTQIEIESTLVSQRNDEIFPSLTVDENITLTLEKKRNTPQILELLEKFDLSYLLKVKPKNLSGGEKRILSIIRGLLSDAPFILIDEPTNDLDYKRVDQLLQLLKEYCVKKTFLIVTHDDRVQAVADKIYTLENQEIYLVEAKTKEACCTGHSSSIDNNKQTSICLWMWKVLKYQLMMVNLGCLKRSRFNSKHTLNRIQKVFPFHLGFPLFVVLISIFAFYSLRDVNRLSSVALEYIQPNQVDIISPITIRQDNLISALPINLIQMILDASERLRQRELEAYIDQILNAPLTFSTSELESENFTAFPLEYWRQSDGRFFQPFDVYVETLLGEEIGTIFVDSSEIFVDSFWDVNEEAVVPMDPQRYLEANRILLERYGSNEDPLKLTYIVLILNESFDFFDLLVSEDMEEVTNSNYWIRSNEIIFLLNQVRVFSVRRDFINQWLVIGGGLFIANVIFGFLYLTANRKKLIILKNYGFDQVEIRVKLAKKFSSKALSCLSYLCIFLVNFKFVWHTPLSETFVGFLPSLVSFISLVSSNGINQFTTRFYLKRLYHWKSR